MSEDIRIRIGVAVDASAAAVLAPIEAAAKRARKTISTEMAAAGKAVADETKKGATSAEREWAKLEKELERDANKILRDQTRAAREATSVVAREARAQAREKAKALADEKRAVAQAARDRVNLEREAARAIARAKRLEEAKERQHALSVWRRDILTGRALQPGSGGAIGIGRRAGIRVSRGAAVAYGLSGRAASTATDIGLDLAHGLGYDTDLQSHIRRSQEQRSLATKVSNAGFVPGTSLVDPTEILSKAREVGNATGTDVTDALDSLRAFVNKTGDLKTGLTSLQSMAELSKATGTRLEDMANAAAEVTNNLGNAPDKAARVDVIMKAIAGQGKLGAVEIRQMASQMAKLASVSHQFAGGAKTIIPLMGVFAQESKIAGGSASPTQAATSVMRLASDLTKSTTLKHWAAIRAPVPGHPGKFEGLSPFLAGSKQTILDDPTKIIMAALTATRGNIPKLNSLFPNSMSQRSIRGFADIYSSTFRETSGTEEQKNAAAVAAVTAQFEKFHQAQLDDEEVHRAFAETMKLSESKSAIFNNKMTEIAEKLSTAALPAIDELGKALIGVAGKAAEFIELVFPGAKEEKNREEGENLLKQLPAEERAAAQVVDEVDPKTGKKTGRKVYSGEAKQVLEGNVGKAEAKKFDLEVQAKKHVEQSSTWASLATYNPIGDAILGVLGMEQFEKKSKRYQKNAEVEQQQATLLGPQIDTGIRILTDIKRAIDTQTAVLSAPPAPAADKSGTAPPEADVW